MLPAFPCPNVLVLSSAPLVMDRDLVVTLILPPLPTPPDYLAKYSTGICSDVSVPSRETCSEA